MVKLPIIFGTTTYFLSLLRLSIPTQWLENSIGNSGFTGQSKGFLLGILTPVCSCVVAPIYAGLIQAAHLPNQPQLFSLQLLP